MRPRRSRIRAEFRQPVEREIDLATRPLDSEIANRRDELGPSDNASLATVGRTVDHHELHCWPEFLQILNRDEKRVSAADGVLANSEREPFGLVGLEVMASGGIAYVGRTGEDYAVPLGNAVVMQSDDPRELLATHQSLRARPEIVRAIRSDGRATAKRFIWPRVLDGYEAAWETAFALMS